jgi:hypothetical protein
MGCAPNIMQQRCHPDDKAIGVFPLRKVQGEMIDPLDVLPAVCQISETGETSLYLCRDRRQHVDCLFCYLHV